MKTAILTYCDKKFEWELIHDFLHTLRDPTKGNYSDSVIVLDYGLTAQGRRKVRKYAQIAKCDRIRSIEANRYRDLPIILEDIEADVIMTIDAGDVWFQESFGEIFEICQNNIGYVEENEYCDEKWMKEIIGNLQNSQYKLDIQRSLKNKRVIGSGMLCGDRYKLKMLFEETWDVIGELAEDFFGVVQIALNMAVRKKQEEGEGKFRSLSKTYDYVVITNKNETYYENGIVYDEDHAIVKIAHNAGGIYRIIDRKDERRRRFLQNFGFSMSRDSKSLKYSREFLNYTL